MKTNVFDIANYILQQTGSLTTMKLQKLVYYSQAWSLVWDEKALFPEHIEAWANGPVVPVLYEAHRGMYTVIRFKNGDSSKVTGESKETIDKVIEALGDKSAKWLIDLTHIEEPWIEARKGLQPNDRGNHIISWDSMANYYSQL